MAQKVIFSEQLELTLETAIAECNPDRLFVLTDVNTQQYCWPVIKDYACLATAKTYSAAAAAFPDTRGVCERTGEGVIPVS